jgi:outer membrane protein W
MKAISTFFTLLFFLFVGLCQAQTTEKDEVKLNNKTIYRGKLVSQKPGEFIRFLEENSNDTITISMGDIEEIKKVKSITTQKSGQLATENQHVFNTNRIQVGFSYYQGGGDVRFQGFGMVINYLKTESFGIGLAVAYQGETGSSDFRSYQWQKIPIMIEASYDLQKYFNNRAAFYARLGAGYSFTLNGDYLEEALQEEIAISNGFILNPGIGFRYNVLKNCNIKTDVSYQFITDQSKLPNGDTLANLKWDVIVLRLSLLF